MLFQLAESDLIFSKIFLGDFFSIGIQVVIIILGYFIYKKNSYTYGRYFMISAISSIITIILSALLRYFSVSAVVLGLFLLIPSSFGIVGTVFLILAIYKVYDTHRTNIIESKIK